MKVLIFFQYMYGQPNYIKASELEGGREVRPGMMESVEGIPNIPYDVRSFNQIVVGDFEVVYKWKDFRGKWHECSESKYQWCMSKGVRAERIYKYVGAIKEG